MRHELLTILVSGRKRFSITVKQRGAPKVVAPFSGGKGMAVYFYFLCVVSGDTEIFGIEDIKSGVYYHKLSYILSIYLEVFFRFS